MHILHRIALPPHQYYVCQRALRVCFFNRMFRRRHKLSKAPSRFSTAQDRCKALSLLARCRERNEHETAFARRRFSTFASTQAPTLYSAPDGFHLTTNRRVPSPSQDEYFLICNRAASHGRTLIIIAIAMTIVFWLSSITLVWLIEIAHPYAHLTHIETAVSLER